MKRVTGIGGIFFKAHDPDPKTEESEYGKFGWVMDPDGNRIELWEPPPGRTAG